MNGDRLIGRVLSPGTLAVALGTLIWVGGCQQSLPKSKNDVPLPAQAPVPPPPKPVALDPALHAAALRILQANTDSTNATLRSNAIEALQQAVPQQAAGAVLKGLTDPNPTVCFAAAMAAGELKLADAHDRLLQIHSDSKSKVVQVGVDFALHKLGDTRYSHEFETLVKDPDPEVRGKAALALGLLGEPSAVLLLRPLRHDPEPSVKLQASSSLWRLNDADGLDDLLSWAISKYPDDVILATLALAAPNDPKVIQHVRANLVTDYPEVDLAAARALGELGSDEGYVLAMKGVADQDDPELRFLGALALGSIGRSDAQDALAKLLNDPSQNVRLAAATAILELHG